MDVTILRGALSWLNIFLDIFKHLCHQRSKKLENLIFYGKIYICIELPFLHSL